MFYRFTVAAVRPPYEKPWETGQRNRFFQVRAGDVDSTDAEETFVCRLAAAAPDADSSRKGDPRMDAHAASRLGVMTPFGLDRGRSLA
jgi:hypothetical protein